MIRKIDFRLILSLIIMTTVAISPLVLATEVNTQSNESAAEKERELLEDKFIANDVLFYDPDQEDCEEAPKPGTVEANDVLEKILLFLTSKNLTLEQAAGIAGNVKVESSFDPASDGIDTNGLRSRGLFQWNAGRGERLEEFAKKMGRSWQDADAQLEYFWYESTGGGYETDQFKKVLAEGGNSVEAVAGYFDQYWERSDGGARAKRAAYALDIYNAYKGQVKSGDGNVKFGEDTFNFSGDKTRENNRCAPRAAIGCSGGELSYDNFATTKSVPKGSFLVYMQDDKRWGHETYSNGTFANSACGLFTTAMAITCLTGKTFDHQGLLALRGLARQYGGEMSQGGSNRHGMKQPLKQHGVGIAEVFSVENSASSVNKINTIFKSNPNGEVFLMTGGSGQLPGTPGGHIFGIRGVTSDGKWILAQTFTNPSRELDKNGWNPSDVLRSITNGGPNSVMVLKRSN